MKTMLLVMAFSRSFGCIGQNVYKSNIVYYNMDTARCVDYDARFWEGGKFNTYAGNPDSINLYCVLKKNLELPIVTINDDKIKSILDSCLTDAPKCNYLKFPDTSGYYVEILIGEKSNDSSMLDLSITPYSNYYMATSLGKHEFFYEWFGYYEKNLRGCFFMNDILCVVISLCKMDYGEKASCLFSQTNSTLRLALFSPIRPIVLQDPGYYPKFYSNINNCDYVLKHNNIENQ